MPVINWFPRNRILADDNQRDKSQQSLCIGAENVPYWRGHDPGYHRKRKWIEWPFASRQKRPRHSLCVASPSGEKESYVTFQTAEGVKLRGALSRVTRHTAVFELYNPGVTPRFSEVLDAFTIVMQSRAVYSGRAVVSKVLDAGTKVVCEVTLDETGWTDLNFGLLFEQDGQMAKEFKNFLREWQKLYNLSPEFKVVVADMQSFLA